MRVTIGMHFQIWSQFLIISSLLPRVIHSYMQNVLNLNSQIANTQSISTFKGLKLLQSKFPLWLTVFT